MIKEVLNALDLNDYSLSGSCNRQNLVGESLKFEDSHGRVTWSACHDDGNQHITGIVVDELGAQLGQVTMPFSRTHPVLGHRARAKFEGFDLSEAIEISLEGGNLVPFYVKAGLNDNDYATPHDAPRAHIFL